MTGAKLTKAEKKLRQYYPTLMSNFLKEKKIGNWELKKKVIKKGTVLMMYNWMKGCHYHYQYEGDYPIVTLQENGEVWMSDTPYEFDCMRPALDAVKGDVLIGGLGIGMLPTFIALSIAAPKAKPVKSITVVELNQEVIDLVYPQIRDLIARQHIPFRVIKSDIWEYLKTTDARYDFIQIDVWGTVTATIQEIDRALQESQRCLRPNGEIRVWLMELYKNIKDKLPKTPTRATGEIGFHEPCLICGKKLRNDYAGLCMDCADSMNLSEYFIKN